MPLLTRGALGSVVSQSPVWSRRDCSGQGLQLHLLLILRCSSKLERAQLRCGELLGQHNQVASGFGKCWKRAGKRR